ncbi:hypothetical protein A1O3_08976 [Capronia epimyces CBS 606.96]|uniref:Succinylglutamate desuccinylase/Aspartoacylase catalytic domain-containing protein n=1 Tax=Capronia epimyces CBS 606.96 TaxID=1182542 RepID=W9XBF9_9EURO|nr:uncharacterized protein A1O3_08976 [Capronia epimyces CBS 606.96]EXJ77817.1 hypothetical protein A1O3_08976 [Capronia epimyces CBS 606.96]
MATLPNFSTGTAGITKGLITPLEGGPEIPYAILEGGQQGGPVLLVTAGVHGSEVSSIEAALRLMRLDVEGLHGTLIVLPVVNITGYRSRSIYIMPEDGKNLNRQFPGRADGSASQRLAFWISAAFPKCDAYLDLHGGDLDEDLNPFVICNSDSKCSRELAVALGFETIVATHAARRTASAAAGQLGIPALTLEVGHNGIWSEDTVAMHFDGVLRAMAHLGMLKFKLMPAAAPCSQPKFVKLSVPIAPVDGFWYPRIAVGSQITAGDTLGEIRDAFNNVQATCTSDATGEILYLLTSLCVNAGDQLLGIAYPEPA